MPENEQLDKFKAAARELECDDNPAHFDAMVKKIAKSSKKSKDEKES